jgi:hypothetical protein
VQFAFTGALATRVDASGNVYIADQNGTTLIKFVSGAGSVLGNFGTVHTSGVISSTTSTSDVFTGNNVWYTPQVSTKAVILLNAFASNSGVNGVFRANAYRNTGSTNYGGGVAATGAGIGLVVATSATANANCNISCLVLDTGLTAGTAYTYSLAIRVDAGTGTLNLNTQNTSFSVYEF